VTHAHRRYSGTNGGAIAATDDAAAADRIA